LSASIRACPAGLPATFRPHWPLCGRATAERSKKRRADRRQH
jgi:hypothetical protein